MERSLYITNFRNIGISKSQRLVLNSFTDKSQAGSLVIIVGPNNTGKSNYLDALDCYGKKKMSERDVTKLTFDKDHSAPQLSLSCKGDDEFTYRITYGQSPYVFFPKVDEEDFLSTDKDISKLVLCLKTLNDSLVVANRQGYYQPNGSPWTEIKKFLQELENHTSDQSYDMEDIKSRAVSIVNSMKSWHNREINTIYGRAWDYIVSSGQYAEFIALGGSSDKNRYTADSLERAFKAKYGMKFMPNIIRYVDKPIGNNDLISNYNNISNNVFFSVYDGDTPLTLDYQSVGFRWFFDLYFNLLGGQTLECGDIILMDEPAMNLSVPGQIELRKFLKQFVIESGVTVVLATHSPFLIDVDNLDELRVAELRDSEAYISNDFSAIDPEDPDSLEPIKNALMVNSCQIFDPDRKVIFVEGITDYNYLLAFKRILDIKEDIVFLPVKGIGNPRGGDLKQQQSAISKKLIAMRKHNPVLLVDGDNVGKSMKSVNSQDSSLQVIALSDIDSSFKCIETLFEHADLEKLGLIDNDGKYIKHSTTASNVKTFAEASEFSKATLDNFKKLFEYLIRETN